MALPLTQHSIPRVSLRRLEALVSPRVVAVRVARVGLEPRAIMAARAVLVLPGLVEEGAGVVLVGRPPLVARALAVLVGRVVSVVPEVLLAVGRAVGRAVKLVVMVLRGIRPGLVVVEGAETPPELVVSVATTVVAVVAVVEA